jgi:nicotinamidase/pyrazinamidase
MRLELLLIDPQNDFCSPKGSLFVTGADQDSIRIADMIRRLKNKWSAIHVTLDSHHKMAIFHSIFWVDSHGNHPEPLITVITVEDILMGKWRTTNPQYQKRALEYARALKKNKRYILVIWPNHCLIGTWGHNVVDPVQKALAEWEDDFKMVDYVTKGSNFWTEHYSAVQADVPDPQDPTTLLNTPLITTLANADLIPIMGEALSHCMANTIRDIANNFGDENIKKMVLIIDGTSNVPGFEKLGQDFLVEMKGRGMQVEKSVDFLK